jgi:gliding motility-associated-like protein
VDILSAPFADAGPDQTIFVQGTAQLGGSPTAPPGSTVLWSPDSLLSDATVQDPAFDPGVTTWFTVTVTAQNGCIATDSVLITVLPDVVIPTGFTPNGDGWNDTWVIDLVDLFPNIEVEVYNRWGELLFRSVGYKQPWDGKYKGGFVPVGTYYYVINLNDPAFPDPYTGPLTVIR